MDAISVSTAVLVETAGKLTKTNQEMDNSLRDINKTMNDLESTWKSDAASDIRANMDALKPRFEEYKQIISSYAKFLLDSASQYDNTEQAIQTNANRFK